MSLVVFCISFPPYFEDAPMALSAVVSLAVDFSMSLAAIIDSRANSPIAATLANFVNCFVRSFAECPKFFMARSARFIAASLRT